MLTFLGPDGIMAISPEMGRKKSRNSNRRAIDQFLGKAVPKKNGVFFGWFLLGLKMDDGHIPKYT